MQRETGGAARTGGTAFAIRSVEAFHAIERGRDYWQGFAQGNRAASDRYVLKDGWRAAYGRGFETAIVRVTLEDGTVGWGEATEPVCPEVICRLAVHLIAPFVGGRTFERPEQAWDDAYDLQRVRGHVAGYVLHAIAAIDMAVWDALARRSGVPVSALLSDAPATSVPVYLSGLRRGTRAERIEMLARLVGEGLGAVKLFANGDTRATLDEIDALRAGVPGDWGLMVDALWSYDTVAAASEARRAFGDLGVRWLECPLVPEDLESHVALAQEPGCPVALGEHFFTHHQSAPWLTAGALSVFQPDMGRTGFSDGRRQAALAATHVVAVTPHMGSGSPIAQAAALHFWAAVRPDLPQEYQFDLAGVLPGIIDSDWNYAGGALAVPQTPGLGVRVDAERLVVCAETVERWDAP